LRPARQRFHFDQAFTGNHVERLASEFDRLPAFPHVMYLRRHDQKIQGNNIFPENF
jgi:hypothetical protein